MVSPAAGLFDAAAPYNPTNHAAVYAAPAKYLLHMSARPTLTTRFLERASHFSDPSGAKHSTT
jgi:hypothetical protein